jgi:hypothetical protein
LERESSSLRTETDWGCSKNDLGVSGIGIEEGEKQCIDICPLEVDEGGSPGRVVNKEAIKDMGQWRALDGYSP